MRPGGWNQVINPWSDKGYGHGRVHLCKRLRATSVVAVRLQQPIAFAVIGSPQAILTPIVGVLMVPRVLGVALVGLIIGIGSHLLALPCGFASLLAGFMGTESLGLETGIGHKAAPAVGTSTWAVHGCLLCKPSIFKGGLPRKNKNYHQSTRGRKAR